MDVFLRDDGRVFEEGPDDKKIIYEVGDVAWFEEDVLLIVAVKDGRAEAIEHPAAAQMMNAALTFGPKGPDRINHGMVEAMRIHARAMTKLWLAAAGPAAIEHTKLSVSLVSYDAGPRLLIEIPGLPGYAAKLDEATCAELCASLMFAAAIMPGVDLEAFLKRVKDLSLAKGEAYDAETAAQSAAAAKDAS